VNHRLGLRRRIRVVNPEMLCLRGVKADRISRCEAKRELGRQALNSLAKQPS
jgi:hypothetical protein